MITALIFGGFFILVKHFSLIEENKVVNKTAVSAAKLAKCILHEHKQNFMQLI